MKQFENVLTQINEFSKAEKKKLGKYILSLCEANSLFETRSEIIDGVPVCPHCESKKVKKNGSHNGKQRYVCLEDSCGRGFRDMTGTFVYRMQNVSKLPRFIELMLESKSIREIAKELEMARQTVLDWRHKILCAFNETFTKEFMGIVETDDVYMRFNQKGRTSLSGTFLDEYRRTFTVTNAYGNRVSKRFDGLRRSGVSDEQVAVLFCVDRYKTIGTKMLRKGKINTASVKRVFNSDFDKRFNYGNIMVTDGETAYNRVFSQKIYSHESVVINLKKKRFKRGYFHLNTLNNVDGRFKKWIKTSFSSVATKYLDNYLMYFKMLFFVLAGSDDKESDLLQLALVDNKTHSRMKLLESEYWKFLEY